MIERIRALASASPTEICGALLADGQGVFDAIPLINQSPQPDRRFFIPAAEIARLELEAERSGKLLAGFYHSHPRGAATPSAFDLDLAVPGYTYWIATRQEVRAWRLRDDRSGFDEAVLT